MSLPGDWQAFVTYIWKRGPPGASPPPSSPRDRETPATRRPPKRSERSVQTCARVCQGHSLGSWVRGARSPASAPPTPTCAAARRPSRCGRPENHRYLFRELPLTAAGRHTHQTVSPVAETFPPELPFGFWLAPDSRARAVPSVPPQPHRARPAGGAPTYLERGARAEGAAHARALSRARCSLGAARPRGIAPRPGAGLGWRAGSGSAPRLPRASALTGSRWRGAPRPAHRPRGLRTASAAPPGQGKDYVRLGAGVPEEGWRARAPRATEVTQTQSTSSAHRLGAGLPERVRPRQHAEHWTPRPPDPRRPPSTLVAPTPRQGLARRPGGAGKSRPLPPTSLMRHWGSRARAPRTPRAPRLAPSPTPRSPPGRPRAPAGPGTPSRARTPPRGWGRGGGRGGWRCGRGAAVLAGFRHLSLPRPHPCLGVSSGDQPGGVRPVSIHPQRIHNTSPAPQRRAASGEMLNTCENSQGIVSLSGRRVALTSPSDGQGRHRRAGPPLGARGRAASCPQPGRRPGRRERIPSVRGEQEPFPRGNPWPLLIPFEL